MRIPNEHGSVNNVIIVKEMPAFIIGSGNYSSV
jgi:hypothetical protein